MISPSLIGNTIAAVKQKGKTPSHWRMGRDVKRDWFLQAVSIPWPSDSKGVRLSKDKPFTMGQVEGRVDYSLAPDELILVATDGEEFREVTDNGPASVPPVR